MTTAPRLKIGGVVRDDTYDGVARLRVDNYGSLHLDAEDLAAMALLLASPPAVNRAAVRAEAVRESEARQREEAARRERERLAAGAARAADVQKLREQFPTLADQLFPVADDVAAFYVVMVSGGQKAYLERLGLGGPLHTSDRARALRFSSRTTAEAQARALDPHAANVQYLIEEAAA